MNFNEEDSISKIYKQLLEAQKVEVDDEEDTEVDLKKKDSGNEKDPAAKSTPAKDKKKEKDGKESEDDEESDVTTEGADWDWDALGIAKGLSHITHAKQYRHAAEVLRGVIDRKKQENGGRLKKGVGYYASTIAKQYSGVDTRKLMKMIGEDVDMVNEKSGDKEAYQNFFNSALKKFGVKSPAELSGDKEKEFYDYVDKNWEGDNEVKESRLTFQERSEMRMGALKAKIQQYKTTDGMTEEELNAIATKLGISVVKLQTLLDEEE